jgi:hypothetical protein
LAEELGVPIEDVTKKGSGSAFLFRPTKAVAPSLGDRQEPAEVSHGD